MKPIQPTAMVTAEYLSATDYKPARYKINIRGLNVKITKSKSGHYTVTLLDEYKSVKFKRSKLPSLTVAREIAREEKCRLEY